MSDSGNATDLDPAEPAPSGGRKRLIALVTPLLVVLGVSLLVALWWRRGGARATITNLAEQGAVRLADAVVDEVLGAAS